MNERVLDRYVIYGTLIAAVLIFAAGVFVGWKFF